MFQYFVANEDTKFMNRVWACLSPPVALTQTNAVLTRFEASQVGAQGENIFSEYNNFSIAWGLLMMVIDCIWILLLGLYLD